MRPFPDVAFVAGTLGRGGAERQLYYMLQAMVAAGARPVVATLIEGEHWEEQIRDLGVDVHWFGRSHNAVQRVRDLVAALAPRRPELLQSVYFHTNLYAAAAARALRVPEIGAIRSDTHWAVESLGRAGRPSLRVPRHLAINSIQALQQASELGVPATRLTLLPNVVDTVHFRPPEVEPAPFHLLAVGRLVPVKRHDRFLALVRRLVDAVPDVDVRGTIVGEGPLEGELRSLVRELGLGERVELVANPSMAETYQRASAFVLTSDTEGTPNVVLEAMATSLPVVAFGVGGVPDLLPDPDVGVLLDPGDEDGLFDAVLRLVREPVHRETLGAAARAFIERRHSPASLPDYLHKLYRRVSLQPRFRPGPPAGALPW